MWGTIIKMFGGDPSQPQKYFTIIIWAHFFTIISIFVGHLCFKSGRKQLRKYWRLSKEGPLYKLAQWLFWKGVHATAWVDRKFLGERMLSAPTGCKPRFTVIKTQSDRIICNWEAPRSSKWLDDDYQLQVRADGSSADGWSEIYSGKLKTYDHQGLSPGTPHHFRVRTVNNKGESEWASGTFETRQVPVENGGQGLGYTWRQTGQDIGIYVPCRPNAKSKEITVECKATHLMVQDKGVNPPQTLVNGELVHHVKSTEINWNLTEEGGKKTLVVVLEKVEMTEDRKSHWRNVIKGHPFIDQRFLPKGIIPGRIEL